MYLQHREIEALHVIITGLKIGTHGLRRNICLEMWPFEPVWP